MVGAKRRGFLFYTYGMKVIEQLYQETEIHFALQNDGHVMVNATEMAKNFGRRTKDFMKTNETKSFISALERALIGAHSEGKIIHDGGHTGIFFERRLALKFAAWLDPEFEVWIFTKLDELFFGNYKKHYDAHMRQKQLEVEVSELESELRLAPTPDLVATYFSKRDEIAQLTSVKRKAIKDQLQLDLFNNQ